MTVIWIASVAVLNFSNQIGKVWNPTSLAIQQTRREICPTKLNFPTFSLHENHKLSSWYLPTPGSLQIKDH